MIIITQPIKKNQNKDKSRNLFKFVSVLLSASVERVGVSRMWDFLFAPWCKKCIVRLNIRSFILQSKCEFYPTRSLQSFYAKKAVKLSVPISNQLYKLCLFSDYISLEILLCCKKQDYVVTDLYCIVFKQNIRALF